MFGLISRHECEAFWRGRETFEKLDARLSNISCESESSSAIETGGQGVNFVSAFLSEESRDHEIFLCFNESIKQSTFEH